MSSDSVLDCRLIKFDNNWVIVNHFRVARIQYPHVLILVSSHVKVKVVRCTKTYWTRYKFEEGILVRTQMDKE